MADGDRRGLEPAGAEHVLDWLAREAPVPATPVTMPRSE
jgi:hypothetical protein